MAPISTRNAESQSQIFPSEIAIRSKGLLKWAMAKRKKIESKEIFLGEWLKLDGIGPTEAAEIAGCTQGYISNISRGEKTNVNTLYLLRLSEHLGITVNDFFKKPPANAQIASLRAFSPEAQEFLLRPKKQKRA
jgi:hypothetical protein